MYTSINPVQPPDGSRHVIHNLQIWRGPCHRRKSLSWLAHDTTRSSSLLTDWRSGAQFNFPIGEVKNHLGQTVIVYQVCKRDSFVVVAQLSPEFTAALVDRWQELERQAAQPRELSTIEILQIAIESEKARLMLSAQVEHQATRIHSLENLFKEGMTHTQFCKGLNGVNVMQVGKCLESRGWLFNESKSGLRFRVASYARDKYMTEHQVEITPHGKEPFVSFTPVLLKKGAVRLYDLYLAGDLPMKKTWDGLFTHDKALPGG